MQVRTAIFPVAGLGTRFLPATKASPKEMLPVVDKPIIQYAVEEAIEAGVTQLVFVTSITKRSIEDHFDSNYELEDKLEKSGKTDVLEMLRNIIPPGVTCAYVRQPQALGLGHAVLCAKPLIGNQPFAVLLADDMIYTGGKGCLSAMVDIASEMHSSVISVEEVPREDVGRYGIMDVQSVSERVHRVNSMVEKPSIEEAPSQLAAVGRYVLAPRIMSILESTKPGTGGEIQLTDAISTLLEEQRVLAYQFEGTRYDCGSKFGYIKATVEYALRHKELKEDFTQYLQELNLEED
jgi:UTP--glucose-1-phosphate uridylyltransferase